MERYQFQTLSELEDLIFQQLNFEPLLTALLKQRHISTSQAAVWKKLDKSVRHAQLIELIVSKNLFDDFIQVDKYKTCSSSPYEYKIQCRLWLKQSRES